MTDTSPIIGRRAVLGVLGSAAAAPLLPGAAFAQSIPPNTYRVPGSAFGGLNFPYSVNYVTIGGYRMAWYYAAGSGAAGTIVLLHGNPTWAYLYHEMIGGLVSRGYRVYLPDLIGFGRSDKPLDPGWYTYSKLASAVYNWFNLVGLHQNVNLFCQDWGGLLGLRAVVDSPERFARVIVSNTALPHGQALPDAFITWRDRQSPVIPRASDAVAGGIVTRLSSTDIAAYDAPFGAFNGRDTLVAMRTLPKLVPTTGSTGEGARNAGYYRLLKLYKRPFACMWGRYEPFTAEWFNKFRNEIDGAKLASVQRHHTNGINGGHFIQEDAGGELVGRIDDFIRTT